MSRCFLCPIDLTHRSSYISALPVAAREAQLHGTELCVMTVVPDHTSGMDWRYALREGGGSGPSPKDLIQQAKARIQQVVDEYVPDELPTKLLVRHGTIYKEILEAAEELDVGLIIVAAYRPSLRDFLLGTNAARVVRHAKCSVTVVRDSI